MKAARALLERIDAEHRPFREAVDALGVQGLGRRTPAGWTAKEMVAHIAFWEEAGIATITSMFRGEQMPAGWRFGSGYEPEEPWPRADVHNAREAAWARVRSPEEVLERWTWSHDRLISLVGTLTDEEVSAHEVYLRELDGRYRDHLPELQALLEKELEPGR